MKTIQRIAFANTLRGIAALTVVINHYFGVFWLSRDVIERMINAPSLPLGAVATPEFVLWISTMPYFNWGAFGVALFFLISGFVIPFSLCKLTWGGFLLNRLMRLVPTYLVGFGITLLAIFICSQYFSRVWPFSIQEVLFHSIPSLRDLTLSRHIDYVVWTLEIEVKFYFVCAALIFWFRRYSLKVFIAPIILFVVALILNKRMLGIDKSHWEALATFIFETQYLIYMFIGVIFHFLYVKKVKSYQAFLGIPVLFILFCIQWSVGPISGGLNLAWSYAFALLTFTFAYNYPHFFDGNRVFNFFANISYPLYIVHGVFGYVLLRILLDKGYGVWISVSLVMISSILISWLMHVLVERPTQSLGKRLGLYFPKT